VTGRLRHAVDWRVRGIVSRLDTLLGETAALRERVDALAVEVAEIRAATRAVVSEEAENRRRLYTARASAEHELAWTDPDPLVTIAIPTRDRPELLAGRSIPSALAQTHGNLEVVVVGDAAGEEVAAAALSTGDPRVRYAGTTHRVVQPDAERQWLVGSTLARNEAHRLARGRWIVDLDDDDALRPDAVESLLALARAERLEVAYGDLVMHLPDGTANRLGRLPAAVRRVPLAGGDLPCGPAVLRPRARGRRPRPARRLVPRAADAARGRAHRPPGRRGLRLLPGPALGRLRRRRRRRRPGRRPRRPSRSAAGA
jgi:hypothetical protein